jgi:hypothetical protein
MPQEEDKIKYPHLAECFRIIILFFNIIESQYDYLQKIPENQPASLAAAQKRFQSMYNDYYGFGSIYVTPYVKFVDFLCNKLCGNDVYHNLYKTVYDYHVTKPQFFDNLHRKVLSIDSYLKRVLKSQYDFEKDIVKFKNKSITEYSHDILIRARSTFQMNEAGFEKTPLYQNFKDNNMTIHSMYQILDGNNFDDILGVYLK